MLIHTVDGSETSKSRGTGETQAEGKHEARLLMEGELSRRDFLRISGVGLAGATLLGGAACGGGFGRSSTEAAAAAPGTALCRVGARWENYPNTLSLVPSSTCTPESLADIVAIVREAEAANKRVHAFGSKWSFSDCAIAKDYVIDTKQLNRELQTVKHALRPGQQSSHLYHVEAGITIRSLYDNLDRLGLALETMGGASGQTLAGAVSTGTHGGDKFMAPLADSVLAIHLVGAGGTQYWIEPSPGITDPARLKTEVAPDVDPQNIIYDDATFEACLVSLGCMGIIYAVVLRVREPYDLVEKTVETTWQAFKESASAHLRDPDNRFLQVILNPYKDDNNDNFCLLATRHEADFTGAKERPDSTLSLLGAVGSMLADVVVRKPGTLFELYHNGVFDGVFGDASNEQKVAKIIDGILTYAPDQRDVLVEHYDNIQRTQWPAGSFRGSSFSVMDLGYGRDVPSSQPGYSIELHFQAMDASGRLGFVEFVDSVIATVNAATETLFSGYVSVRFTGSTRASLGMQQWDPTCTVEISVLQGVQGLRELLAKLYRIGLDLGGLPHWGQLLDLGVQGHGRLYKQYAVWRQVYAKMSDDFTARTFENDLSSRWGLTTPD